MNLLNQIKNQRVEQIRKHSLTDEDITIALAWLKDEFNPVQYEKVVKKNFNYAKQAIALRHAFRKGRIIIK